MSKRPAKFKGQTFYYNQSGKSVDPLQAQREVQAYATVGEVMGVLKEVYGTYDEPLRF